MKKFYFNLLLLPLSLFVMSSCTDSDEDRNYVSLVTVAQNIEGTRLFQRSDSSLMYPKNFVIGYDLGQRVLIEYEIKNTNQSNNPYRYEIKLDAYEKILTKSVLNLTADNEATVGNDAFWNVYDVNSAGGFLNVYMSFLYNYAPHFINLVNNEITPPTNRPDSINLELRQNANGANIGFPVRELVSFNVVNYIDAAEQAGLDSFVIVMKVLLPNNVTSSYKVRFNLKKANDEPRYNTLDVFDRVENSVN